MAGVHFFFPDPFRAPETSSRSTTGSDGDANLANGALHNRPDPLHSYCAGGILQYDGLLWPLAPSPSAASGAKHCRGKSQFSPPFLLVAIEIANHHREFPVPFLSLKRTGDHRALGDLDHQRPFGPIAHLQRLPTPLRQCRTTSDPGVARDAWGDGLDRWTPAPDSTGHESMCCLEPPADNARPKRPVDDETSRDAPSHHHRRPNDAAAETQYRSTSPRPTGAGKR